MTLKITLVLIIALFIAVPKAGASEVENYKLSEHFQSKEFACHHCGECRINVELLIALEKLRATVDCPIIITSGYRCPKHNKAVGGAKNSQHLYGNAVDIKVKGYTPKEVARLAKKCGFIWTKVYKTWTHCDVRRTE